MKSYVNAEQVDSVRPELVEGLVQRIPMYFGLLIIL